MSGERKLWTVEEDEVLKELKEKGIKKCSVIAKVMEEDYGVQGRSGKQCRQRWFNRLDPKINSQVWSHQDDIKLFKLHDELGNSWVIISKQFKGRTDNSIKNHFYSILRKAIRKINKFISCQQDQNGKSEPLATGLVSKIVNAADDKFDKKLFLQETIIETAHEIKNRLVPYADCSRNQPWCNTPGVIKLIEDIRNFQKQFNLSERTHDKKSCKPKTVVKQEQNQKEIIQERNEKAMMIEDESYDFSQKKISFIKQDFFKPSGSFGDEFLFDLSKRESGNGTKQKQNMYQEGFQKSQVDGNESPRLMKKLSGCSGVSSMGQNLFPPFPSYQWDRQALMNSANNIHGQYGFIPSKEQFLYENLDKK